MTLTRAATFHIHVVDCFYRDREISCNASRRKPEKNTFSAQIASSVEEQAVKGVDLLAREFSGWRSGNKVDVCVIIGLNGFHSSAGISKHMKLGANARKLMECERDF